MSALPDGFNRETHGDGLLLSTPLEGGDPMLSDSIKGASGVIC